MTTPRTDERAPRGAALDDDGIRRLLESASTIAVVGASNDTSKPAHRIPKGLVEAGFRMIPVNPDADEVAGQRAYPTLDDIPEPVDVVDVFRPADEAPEIARSAVAMGADALWLQLDITSDDARAIALDGGVDYVEDRCIGQTVKKMGIRKTGG